MCAALTAGGCGLRLRRQTQAAQILSDLTQRSRPVQRCWNVREDVLSHAGWFVHECAAWPVTRLVSQLLGSSMKWSFHEDLSFSLDPRFITDAGVQGWYPPTDLLPHPGELQEHRSLTLQASPIQQQGIDPHCPCCSPAAAAAAGGGSFKCLMHPR